MWIQSNGMTGKSQIKGKGTSEISGRNKILFDFTTQIYEALDEFKNRRFDLTCSQYQTCADR
jgi:hypothetical protein